LQKHKEENKCWKKKENKGGEREQQQQKVKMGKEYKDANPKKVAVLVS